MKRGDPRRRTSGGLIGRPTGASSAQGPAAVVVGLDNITGLQTARILAGRGVRVYGVAADRRHFGSRTNACVDVVESRLSGAELIDALVRLAPRLGPDPAVLMPCTDGAVWSLSQQR